jgi:hypothetical protein
MNPQDCYHDKIKENNIWENIHSNWNMFEPKTDTIVRVSVFDDGNQDYKNHKNEWYVYGSWRDKIALVNRYNTDIRIGSISSWKTSFLFELR